MKNPEYNLLDEPWIPVRLLDGTIADVGSSELSVGDRVLVGGCG